jgi:hypothetical protein
MDRDGQLLPSCHAQCLLDCLCGVALRLPDRAQIQTALRRPALYIYCLRWPIFYEDDLTLDSRGIGPGDTILN